RHMDDETNLTDVTRRLTMKARMKNPAMIMEEAMQPLQAIGRIPYSSSVPQKTLALSHMRASQINGCAPCIDMGWRHMKKMGETDGRTATLAGWRESPYCDEAERAALALTEAVTRLPDREDAVPDAVWDEAARHFDEKQLAALLLSIATTNLYNR